MTDQKKEQVINNFLTWCEKLGYSGKDGVRVVIVDGLPVSVERPTQSLRFDLDLTDKTQNATMV